MRMVLKPGPELPLQQSPHVTHVLEQILLLDDPLHGQRRGTRDGVALVRLAVPEHARPLVQRIHDLGADQHARDGRVAAAETLAQSLDVWHDALLFPGVERARTAHSAHYFVEDEQGTVLVADGFHGGEVPWEGGDAAQSLEIIIVRVICEK